MDVLEHKPGALAGSTPLEQWRRLGRWPASYDRFWQGLIARLGRAAGTREMIGLLQLGRVHGQDALRRAIETALGWGCGDSAAVRHLLTTPDLVHAPQAPLEIPESGPLAHFERPLPAVTEYDRLLVGGGAR